MAEIAKSGQPSLATLTTQVNSYTGLYAGEDLEPGDAVYIKASDGRLWKSSGAAANAAAKVRGYVGVKCQAGEACTYLWDVRFRYAALTGLTNGADVFLSATVPGGLSDAATTGGVGAIGYVVEASKGLIYLHKSRY